jgi:hypothetical protein
VVKRTRENTLQIAQSLLELGFSLRLLLINTSLEELVEHILESFIDLGLLLPDSNPFLLSSVNLSLDLIRLSS